MALSHRTSHQWSGVRNFISSIVQSLCRHENCSRQLLLLWRICCNNYIVSCPNSVSHLVEDRVCMPPSRFWHVVNKKSKLKLAGKLNKLCELIKGLSESCFFWHVGDLSSQCSCIDVSMELLRRTWLTVVHSQQKSLAVNICVLPLSGSWSYRTIDWTVLVVGAFLWWARRLGICCQTVLVAQNWVSILSNVSWRHTFLRNNDDKMY